MSRDEVEKVLGKTALVQLEEGIKVVLWTGRVGAGQRAVRRRQCHLGRTRRTFEMTQTPNSDTSPSV
jgi:hypothetical protein